MRWHLFQIYLDGNKCIQMGCRMESQWVLRMKVQTRSKLESSFFSSNNSDKTVKVADRLHRAYLIPAVASSFQHWRLITFIFSPPTASAVWFSAPLRSHVDRPNVSSSSVIITKHSPSWPRKTISKQRCSASLLSSILFASPYYCVYHVVPVWTTAYRGL